MRNHHLTILFTLWLLISVVALVFTPLSVLAELSSNARMPPTSQLAAFVLVAALASFNTMGLFKHWRLARVTTCLLSLGFIYFFFSFDAALGFQLFAIVIALYNGWVIVTRW